MRGLLQRVLDRWLASRFARNVAVLAGGTALAHGVVLLASPVLTRLYTPEDFGLLAVYAALLSMVAVVACWRYELAIPQAEDEQTAAQLLVLAVLISGLMSAATALLIWFWGDDLAEWLGSPEVRSYLWLVPVGLLGAGLNQALTDWAVFAKAFGLIARTKVNQRLSQTLLQLLMGVASPSPLGLMVGDAAGRAGGSTTLAVFLWRRQKERLAAIRMLEILRVAHRFRRFPLLSSASALLNSAGLQITPLLLAALYDPAVAGGLALGYRAVQAPMMLVGHSISQVYYAEASRLGREDPAALQRLFWQMTGRLLLLGAVPAGVLAASGAPVFAWIFGEDWREAGLFVQLLSVTFLADFVVFPVSSTLTALQRQDWQLGWDAGRLVLVITSVAVPGYMGWAARTAVLCYGLALLAGYGSLWLLAMCAIRRRVKGEAASDGS